MGRKCCQNTFKRVVTFELDLLFAQQTKRHNYISPELSWGWVLMVLMIWLSVKNRFIQLHDPRHSECPGKGNATSADLAIPTSPKSPSEK